MSAYSYTVSATFLDSGLAEKWLAWLREGHIAEVLAGGASDAEVIELDSNDSNRTFEVRYHFPSREVFERYEKDYAPRLRAEGLKLFPVEKGVSYRRSCGAVLVAFSKTMP